MLLVAVESAARGSEATTCRGPLKPRPKPFASRSYECRDVELGGLLPASLFPSRRASAGAASVSMIARPATAPGQGWRWMKLLQRDHAPRASRDAADSSLFRARRPGLPMRSPYRESAAGRSVNAASIVIST